MHPSALKIEMNILPYKIDHLVRSTTFQMNISVSLREQNVQKSSVFGRKMFEILILGLNSLKKFCHTGNTLPLCATASALNIFKILALARFF